LKTTRKKTKSGAVDRSSKYYMFNFFLFREPRI